MSNLYMLKNFKAYAQRVWRETFDDGDVTPMFCLKVFPFCLLLAVLVVLAIGAFTYFIPFPLPF
jgi:hypothetical protein